MVCLAAGAVAFAVSQNEVATQRKHVQERNRTISMMTDREHDLKSDLSDTRRDLSDTRKTVASAEKNAQAKVDARDAKRKQGLDQREQQLNGREQQLNQRAAALDEQRQQLDQQLNGLKANQFDDGLFQVGRDIQPGRYHTDGGGFCYWAELNSSNTSDIADNNLGNGPQTIAISGAYFESRDCGTWTKVG